MLPIHFSHANGFPAACYQPFFSHLSPHPISYVPILGMGNYPVKRSWRPLVDEIIADIEAKHQEPVIGIGHSLGAVATFWAAIKRPDLFHQIIMMDPPLFGWKLRTMMAISRTLGIQDRFVPIIRNAKKRRDHFESREEALTYFQPKYLFKEFPAKSLQAYIDHGLKPAASGGLELVIPKSLEAAVFASSPIWIGSAELKMSSHYLYASKGVLRSPDVVAEHKRRFSHTTFIEVSGKHMFPLEQPERTAKLILELIEKEN